jgi:hypothetical protein
MPRHYDNVSGDPNLGDESARDLAALSQHIGEWFGEGMVWHEIVSEFVHLDVHAIPPSTDRPYYTLITTGMSDRPMPAPEGQEEHRHCELMMALPASWPMDEESFKDERNYWPIRHLKQTARFPHMVETWLWNGHTVGNGNDLTRVVPSAPFVGFALATPTLWPETARRKFIRKGKDVSFFALIPLYEAELKFAWENGIAALFEKLDAAGVTEIVQVTRACVITRRCPPVENVRRGWAQRLHNWLRKRRNNG